MAITKRSEAVPAARCSLLPWDPFQTMREMLNTEPVPSLHPERLGTYMPAFDVWETKDAYIFKADAPGFREQDIDVSVTGNRLSISGQRDADQVSESDTFYCTERSSGSFTRTFTLPEGVNTDRIRAELKDGVLSLHVPKVVELQSKRIIVQGTTTPGKVKA